MKHPSFTTVALAMLIGCGGDDGSGVDGDKLFVKMTDDEGARFCEYIREVAGPLRTVVCDSGESFTVGGQSQQQCVMALEAVAASYPSCMATVAEAEACAEAFASDGPCDGPPAECDALNGPGCR